ncbi:MAG: ATP-binding cassette domain-containing protein, partial [Vallitaleaceae bacterium]|nr:ATP-binding cassette domain-containing protein [Vallitaleaceae bacterium]
MKKQVIIELKDIEVEYPDFKLKQVNMKLYEGEIVGFIGKNGAGKSTTMKAMLQLIKYNKGEVLYKGEKIANSTKAEIGYIGEYNDFYEKISVKEITRFIKSNYKERWNDSLYKDLLHHRFNINEKKKINELSTG